MQREPIYARHQRSVRTFSPELSGAIWPHGCSAARSCADEYFISPSARSGDDLRHPGEVFMIPDPDTRVFVPFDGSAAEYFFIGDIQTMEGEPWAFCPPTFCAAPSIG